jgi:universal stress protein A
MPAKKKSGAGKSGAKVVVSSTQGHGRATAPLSSLTPLRFQLRRILVPVDFSEPSRKALHYAKQFALQFEAEVTVLHVLEPLTYPPDFAVMPLLPPDLEEARTREIELQLRELAADLGAAITATSLVRSGRPWHEVVECAKELGTDLIVVSTHGYTGLKHALLGSVAEKIVRHAPCPVLVVRNEEHDFT